MASSCNSALAKDIQFLETINQLIDLCIDNGCYETIKEMIPDDNLFTPEKDDQIADNISQIIQDLREWKSESNLSNKERKDKDFIAAFSLGNSDCPPVVKVSLPKDFKGKFSRDSISLDGNELLKPWSCLLWAKLIRAELYRQNRNPWLKLYEKIILYLEANIRLCIPNKSRKDNNYVYKTTLLNYLMELSATSLGEASLGYAERARIVCNELLSDTKRREREERKKYGHPYDRWIWYNKGLAYQHTQRHQDAIDQFSEVVDKFFNKYSDISYQKDIEANIEFLLNIAPAIMQTSEIYIQDQLAYHALKSLNDNNFNAWLKCICDKHKEINIIHEVARKLKTRRELIRLEALLRLGDLDYSEEYIEKLHPKIEITGAKGQKYDQLPQYDQSRTASIFQVKFIEHKVIWYRENAIRLQDYIIHKKNCGDSEKDKIKNIIKKRLKKLICRMDMVRNRYWPWVQDNPQDKKVYFSNWAQLLGIGMKIIKLLDGNQPWIKKEYENLLKSIVKLYEKHKKSLPDPRGKLKNNGIVLQDLRSDDPFDIRGGLKDFYKEMISIKSSDKTMRAKDLIEEWHGMSYYDELQSEHNQFLDALAKWDQDFGVHQRIEALKRCNERIKWLVCYKKDCKSCLSSKKCILPSLLSDEKQGSGDVSLFKDDYELIMSEAEDHFIKHLKDNSSHVPLEKSLHFIGLQRWNSLTPAQGKSIGGGYFVYHTDNRGEVDLGIAIDPGFDFIRNLFRQGFSIRDIDIILISHAHPDHLWDFESIVQLLHDLNQKKKVEHHNHRINVILTSAAYQRYDHYVIRNHELRQFIEPFVIDLHKGQENKELEPFLFIENKNNKTESERQPHRWKPILPLSQRDGDNDNGPYEKPPCEIKKVVITPSYAYHDDYSQISDSYGFLLKFEFENGSEDICFGYTGDTKWVGNDLYLKECHDTGICQGSDYDKCPENIAHQYRDCDVLLIHLGSLIDHKIHDKFNYYKGPNECEMLVREKNHLYLMGMSRFLHALSKNAGWICHKDKLLLISEFGEELQGGIRIDIVRRLEEILPSQWRILPVDVGLDVLLNKKEYKFICTICNKERALGQIAYERYGYDEAIFYFCQTCIKARPWDVRQDRMRQLYEVGKELKVLPSKEESEAQTKSH